MCNKKAMYDLHQPGVCLNLAWDIMSGCDITAIAVYGGCRM